MALLYALGVENVEIDLITCCLARLWLRDQEQEPSEVIQVNNASDRKHKAHSYWRSEATPCSAVASRLPGQWHCALTVGDREGS